MKKIMLFVMVPLSLLLMASAAFAVSPSPQAYGTWVTVTASDVITNTFTATGVLEIIAQDDGNTSAARHIAVWDTTGNTVFSKSFSVGQVIPQALLSSQIIGVVGQNPVSIYHSALPITTTMYIWSTFRVSVLKK